MNESLEQENASLTGESVTTGGADLTLSDPGIIAIGLRAERMVIALKQIRAAVLKLTNERDWGKFGWQTVSERRRSQESWHGVRCLLATGGADARRT